MIYSKLNDTTIPQGFAVEFKIHKNALTFNLIDEKDINDTVEIIGKIFERMGHDASALNKDEFQETFYFPFDTRVSAESVLMTVNVRYQGKAKWRIQGVSVEREY